MKALQLNPKMTKRQVQSALEEMVSLSGLCESNVAMVSRRGVPKLIGSRDPRDCENYFYAWSVPYIYVISPEIVDLGATATIAEEVTRNPESSVNPAVKNITGETLPKVYLRRKETV